MENIKIKQFELNENIKEVLQDKFDQLNLKPNFKTNLAYNQVINRLCDLVANAKIENDAQKELGGLDAYSDHYDLSLEISRPNEFEFTLYVFTKHLQKTDFCNFEVMNISSNNVKYAANNTIEMRSINCYKPNAIVKISENTYNEPQVIIEQSIYDSKGINTEKYCKTYKDINRVIPNFTTLESGIDSLPLINNSCKSEHPQLKEHKIFSRDREYNTEYFTKHYKDNFSNNSASGNVLQSIENSSNEIQTNYDKLTEYYSKIITNSLTGDEIEKLIQSIDDVKIQNTLHNIMLNTDINEVSQTIDSKKLIR